MWRGAWASRSRPTRSRRTARRCARFRARRLPLHWGSSRRSSTSEQSLARHHHPPLRQIPQRLTRLGADDSLSRSAQDDQDNVTRQHPHDHENHDRRGEDRWNDEGEPPGYVSAHITQVEVRWQGPHSTSYSRSPLPGSVLLFQPHRGKVCVGVGVFRWYDQALDVGAIWHHVDRFGNGYDVGLLHE